MVSKLRLVDFLERGTDGGGVGYRIQQFRCVKSSRMGFKIIIKLFIVAMGIPYVPPVFRHFPLCSFFHPPYAPLEVVLLQQRVGQSRE